MVFSDTAAADNPYIQGFRVSAADVRPRFMLSRIRKERLWILTNEILARRARQSCVGLDRLSPENDKIGEPPEKAPPVRKVERRENGWQQWKQVPAVGGCGER